MLNFKSLFSGKKIPPEANYNLNYDFESIKLPQKKPSHIMVFTGGISPDPKSVSKILKSLPKPDYIIGADSGLDALSKFQKYSKKADLNPDAVLGDMDSIKDKKLIKEFSKKAQVEKFNPYKDLTDTELALILATKIKDACSDLKPLVTLIGGGGGRIDHLMGIFDLFSSPIAPDLWFTDREVMILLRDKQTVNVLPKTLKSPVSVLRTTASNTKGRVISVGLEWESDVFRSCGLPSISNVISKKNYESKTPVKLTADGADFVVVCEHSAKLWLYHDALR